MAGDGALFAVAHPSLSELTAAIAQLRKLAKVIIAIFYGALYDMIWWQIGGKYDMSNILNMAGLTFTILVGQLMGNMFGAILTF